MTTILIVLGAVIVLGLLIYRMNFVTYGPAAVGTFEGVMVNKEDIIEVRDSMGFPYLKEV